MESTYWLVIGLLSFVIFLIVLVVFDQYRTKKIVVEKLLIKDDLIKVIYRSKNSPRFIFHKKQIDLLKVGVNLISNIKRKTIYSSFIYIESFITLLLFGGAYRGLSQLIDNDFDSLGGVFLAFFVFMLSILILVLTIIKYSKYSILHLKFSKKSWQFQNLNMYFHIKSDSTMFYNILKNDNKNNLQIELVDIQ